jgi:hypothetical protein
VTGDLCSVFTRIGVGGTEDADHTFIENLRAILDVSVVDGVGVSLCQVFGENTRKNLKRLRA